MKIAICYFSATGRTAAMAEAIAGGIREAEPACEVRCLPIGEVYKGNPANVSFVDGADGILLHFVRDGGGWSLRTWEAV